MTDTAFRPVLRRAAVDRLDETGEVETRTRLLGSSIGSVEDLQRHGVRPGRGPEAFGQDFQVCFPYRGLFVWHVGADDVVGDANQVVFVKGGEPFRMSGPLSEGYAELIITPDLEVLSEMAHANGGGLDEHPLFRRRALRASPQLQSLRTRFLRWAAHGAHPDDLATEESVLLLLRAALHDNGSRGPACGAASARLIRRTKELLEANLSDRLLLGDIGRAVGASPAYLTDLFRRVEGTSLHQYLTQLRLARALVELPNADDLTTLALEVGFSSHSHFSSAFRRAFGCTPSQFRLSTQRAQRPEPAIC